MIYLKNREQVVALVGVLTAAVEAGIDCTHLGISQRNSYGLRISTHTQAVDISPHGDCEPKDYGWQLELESQR